MRKKIGRNGHLYDENKDRRGEGPFACHVCGATVTPEGAGTRHRNHCPKCLCSVHVDESPGDRASSCGGVMDAIAIWVRKGEWVIVHRCRKCGKLSTNRSAADDSVIKLLELAVQPIAHAPFPLQYLDRMLLER